jgi:hypothetical protein
MRAVKVYASALRLLLFMSSSTCHMRRRIHVKSYEEEDICLGIGSWAEPPPLHELKHLIAARCVANVLLMCC